MCTCTNLFFLMCVKILAIDHDVESNLLIAIIIDSMVCYVIQNTHSSCEYNHSYYL